MILPNGEQRAIEVSLIPHFGEDGQMLGAFVLITDITRHQFAERAIRDSEERMRKFAAATNEGIFFHNNGILTDANEALLAIMGYTREEMIAHNALEFVAPEWQQTAADYMREGREDPYEAEVVHKKGHNIAVELAGKTLHVGDETYRLGVLRDITARRHAEARIHYLADHDSGARAAPRHAGGDHVHRPGQFQDGQRFAWPSRRRRPAEGSGRAHQGSAARCRHGVAARRR